MSTFVTIDWDFFIPHGMYERVKIHGEEVPGMLVYDWQMSESRSDILESIVWETRYFNFRTWGLDIQKLLTPPLSIEDFSSELSVRMGDYSTPTCWRSDSHAWAGILAKDYSERLGPLSVVNFDAHHDLGYNDNQMGNFKETGNLSCENWAWVGLDQGWIKDYTLVYPDWQGKEEFGPEIRKLIGKSTHRPNIVVKTWSEWKDDIEEVELIHYCRSSSWTAPWLDEGFQRLTEEFGYSECLDCMFKHKGPFDTCEIRRWDWQEVEEMYEQRRMMIDMLKEKT